MIALPVAREYRSRIVANSFRNNRLQGVKPPSERRSGTLTLLFSAPACIRTKLAFADVAG